LDTHTHTHSLSLTGFDETLPNFTKKKAPKKGREKETRGKDQSPGMQTAQKRRATPRKLNH